MRGLFVTGTDTGVGKTVLSAALVAAMAREGARVRAHKPVLTGLDDRGERRIGGWPADHELLALAAGMAPDEVAPLRYGPAVSPHLAAQLAGERIDPAGLLGAVAAASACAPPATAGHLAATRETGRRPDALVIEGVGGLLVPLAEDYAVRDLARAVGLPVLIAARPGLGTINHTLLTLEAARAGRLDVRAVVLTPWPSRPSRVERSNRETIARLGSVEVAGLGPVRSPDRDELARSGAKLPWRRWLAGGPPSPQRDHSPPAASDLAGRRRWRRELTDPPPRVP